MHVFMSHVIVSTVLSPDSHGCHVQLVCVTLILLYTHVACILHLTKIGSRHCKLPNNCAHRTSKWRGLLPMLRIRLATLYVDAAVRHVAAAVTVSVVCCHCRRVMDAALRVLHDNTEMFAP